MNSGLFAPIAPQGLQQQQQMPPQGMPQQGQPAQMPPQFPAPGQMPPKGVPADAPQQQMDNQTIQSLGILGQNQGKYSVGDPTLDRYINLFLA